MFYLYTFVPYTKLRALSTIVYKISDAFYCGCITLHLFPCPITQLHLSTRTEYALFCLLVTFPRFTKKAFVNWISRYNPMYGEELEPRALTTQWTTHLTEIQLGVHPTDPRVCVSRSMSTCPFEKKTNRVE